MAHPGDKGRCLLDGYIECAAKIDAACICEKMPTSVARSYYYRKFGPDDENKASNLVTTSEQPATSAS